MAPGEHASGALMKQAYDPLDELILPGVLVAADDQGSDVLLGRNVLNKLILLLDGPASQVDLFSSRPIWR